MKVLKPRSRTITVRLSETEYDDLCRLSTITGARSLSDLAREGMQMLMKLSNQDRFPSDSLGGFQAQMDQLNRRIDELREQFVSSARSSRSES